MTGMGKSVLTTWIANRWDRVFVYDPNDDPEAELPNATIAYGEKAAIRALPGRVIYRPTAREMADIPAILDRVSRRLLELTAHGFVIHELGDVGTTDASLPPFLSAAWRRGRRRRVPIIACTQRPVNVPLLALTQAQHVVLFHMESRADVARMAEVMGSLVTTDPVPPDHSFYYRSPDLRLARVAPLPL